MKNKLINLILGALLFCSVGAFAGVQDSYPVPHQSIVEALDQAFLSKIKINMAKTYLQGNPATNKTGISQWKKATFIVRNKTISFLQEGINQSISRYTSTNAMNHVYCGVGSHNCQSVQLIFNAVALAIEQYIGTNECYLKMIVLSSLDKQRLSIEMQSDIAAYLNTLL